MLDLKHQPKTNNGYQIVLLGGPLDGMTSNCHPDKELELGMPFPLRKYSDYKLSKITPMSNLVAWVWQAEEVSIDPDSLVSRFIERVQEKGVPLKMIGIEYQDFLAEEKS